MNQSSATYYQNLLRHLQLAEKAASLLSTNRSIPPNWREDAVTLAVELERLMASHSLAHHAQTATWEAYQARHQKAVS